MYGIHEAARHGARSWQTRRVRVSPLAPPRRRRAFTRALPWRNPTSRVRNGCAVMQHSVKSPNGQARPDRLGSPTGDRLGGPCAPSSLQAGAQSRWSPPSLGGGPVGYTALHGATASAENGVGPGGGTRAPDRRPSARRYSSIGFTAALWLRALRRALIINGSKRLSTVTAKRATTMGRVKKRSQF